MNDNRWQTITPGTVLAHVSSGCKVVVTHVERRAFRGKQKVVRCTAVKHVEITEPHQWRAVTADELKRM